MQQGAGGFRRERRRGHHDIVQQFHQDAAGAEHDHGAELRIAVDAEDQFGFPHCHALDEQGLQAGAEAVLQVRDRGFQRGFGGEVEDDATGFGFVHQIGTEGFERDGVADAGGSGGGIMRIGADGLRGDGQVVGGEQSGEVGRGDRAGGGGEFGMWQISGAFGLDGRGPGGVAAPAGDGADGVFQTVGEGQAAGDEFGAGGVGRRARGHDEERGLGDGVRDVRCAGLHVWRGGEDGGDRVVRWVFADDGGGDAGDVHPFPVFAAAEVDRVAGLAGGIEVGQFGGGGGGERGERDLAGGEAVRSDGAAAAGGGEDGGGGDRAVREAGHAGGEQEHGIKIFQQDDAGFGADRFQRGEGAGEAGGVGEGGAGAGAGAAGFDHQPGFAGFAGAAGQGGEAGGIFQAFDIGADDGGARVVDEVLDEIAQFQVRLVADADAVGKADATGAGAVEHGGHHGAGLAGETDLADDEVVGVQGRGGAEHDGVGWRDEAEAVGADETHVAGAGDAGDFGFQRRAFRAFIGEFGGDDDGGAHADGGGLRHEALHEMAGDGHDHHVRRGGGGGEVGVGFEAEQLRAVRVDRVDRAGEIMFQQQAVEPAAELGLIL